MSRMVSAMVVELHPVGYQLGDFSYGLIAPKPQFLVFDASPEALDKHVVHPAGPALFDSHQRFRIGKRIGGYAPIYDRTLSGDYI